MTDSEKKWWQDYIIRVSDREDWGLAANAYSILNNPEMADLLYKKWAITSLKKKDWFSASVAYEKLGKFDLSLKLWKKGLAADRKKENHSKKILPFLLASREKRFVETPSEYIDRKNSIRDYWELEKTI